MRTTRTLIAAKPDWPLTQKIRFDGRNRLDGLARFLDENCTAFRYAEILGAQLLRGNAEHAFEVSGQMALIRKTHGRSDLRQRAITRSCSQQRSRTVDPYLHKILMG